MAIETSTIEGFLSTREGCLVRRESQILEFKRSFTFAALAEYFREQPGWLHPVWGRRFPTAPHGTE